MVFWGYAICHLLEKLLSDAIEATKYYSQSNFQKLFSDVIIVVINTTTHITGY